MDIFTSALLFLGVVAAALYYFLTKNFKYWEKQGVVGPKPEIVFGNVKETTFRRITNHLLNERFYNAYPKEKVVGIFQYWNPVLLVRDLDIVQHVFIRDFDNFTNREFSPTDRGVGENLAFVEGDKWRVLRTKFSPIFSSGKLKNMFHLLQERGDRFMEYLETLIQKTPEQDVLPLVMKYTTSSIAACAFGIDNDVTADDKNLREIDNLIFHKYMINEVELAFRGLFKILRIDLLPTMITEYFTSLVRTIVKERKGVPSDRKDFMDLLLELRNAGEIHGAKKHENDKDRSVTITETMMAAQAFIFYAGGYETSAATLGYMLLELARNPDIQERLVQQVNEVIQENGGKLTFDSLKQMTYLDQTLSETLRMYPTFDPLTRRSNSRYKVPGTNVTIEKDMIVFTSVRGIHYDPQYYPDPHKFDPERFTPENVKARHPCAYLPFGLGPRNCIGLRFANVQSKLAAARILTRYRLEPGAGGLSELRYDPCRIGLSAATGINLKFVPRN